MRLLVTGGAGFIGANFVHRSVRDHPEVAVTVLDSMSYAGSRESLAAVDGEIRLVQGDITDAPLDMPAVGTAIRYSLHTALCHTYTAPHHAP